jgi:hypothetical protein
MMRTPLPQSVRFATLLLAISTMLAAAQQAKPSETPAPSTAPGAAPGVHFDRLAAAKTIFLKPVSGNEIPFNVISRSFEEWGHYVLVDSPEKADIVMEIIGPTSDKEEKDSETHKSTVRTGNKQPEPTKAPAFEGIKATVYDKNHRPMWSVTEDPKFAMRHKSEENNLVEAARRLFTKFHDRVEPPTPKP